MGSLSLSVFQSQSQSLSLSLSLSLSPLRAYVLELKVPIIPVGKVPPQNGKWLRSPPCSMSSEVLLALFAKHFRANFCEIPPYDHESENFFMNYDFSNFDEPIQRHLSSSSSSSSDSETE